MDSMVRSRQPVLQAPANLITPATASQRPSITINISTITIVLLTIAATNSTITVIVSAITITIIISTIVVNPASTVVMLLLAVQSHLTIIISRAITKNCQLGWLAKPAVLYQGQKRIKILPKVDDIPYYGVNPKIIYHLDITTDIRGTQY